MTSVLSLVQPCPEDMTYSFKKSGCPATCQDPEAPQHCHLADTEGCQCEEGLLLKDDHCVAPSMCGCLDQRNREFQVLLKFFVCVCVCVFLCVCVRATCVRESLYIHLFVCFDQLLCTKINLLFHQWHEYIGNVKCDNLAFPISLNYVFFLMIFPVYIRNFSED